MKHVSNFWKMVEVILIPKPGKPRIRFQHVNSLETTNIRRLRKFTGEPISLKKSIKENKRAWQYLLM